MIQRIQTLYLLLVAALTGTTLFTALAEVADATQQYTLTAFHLTAADGSQGSTPYLAVILILATALPVVTIFCFRRRLLQIRLCAVEAVLLFGATAMEAMYSFGSHRLFAGLTEVSWQSFHAPAVLPLLSVVLVWLAARAIFHDEILVRGADRIR